MKDEKTDLMEMTDVGHNMPSDVAARAGHEYMCKKFLEHNREDGEFVKRIQSSIILAASGAGHLRIVKLVFRYKRTSSSNDVVPPNFLQLVDENGRTCLHKAAEKGN